MKTGKHHSRITATIALLGLSLVLTSCSGGSGVRESLGLKKSAPDEFMVISRPPLSVPPEFNLRPPAEAGSTATSDISKRAKEVLFDQQSAQRSGAQTRGEKNLLNRTQTSANPDIRTLLEQENKAAAPAVPEEEKGFLDDILEPIIPKKEDPLVDVEKEEERLTKNKREGKPVTEGETPTLGGESKGLLNDALGL